jgi:uncharacterized membrane protein YuzA (DUF378 family)
MVKYYSYKIEMFIKLIMVLCALNISFTQININLFSKLENILENVLNKRIKFERILYLVGGICTIIFIMNKHNWLPFLGSSVLPSSLIPLKTIDGNTKITINVSPNTKVAYWSAKSTEKQLPTVQEAYDDYSNSGVIMSDADGKATIIFNKGSGYVVPSGRFIDKHVHYRELSDEWGMMGPVQTVYL